MSAIAAALGFRGRSVPLPALVGMAVIFVYAFIAIAASLIAPYGEREIVGQSMAPWSSQHLLGTDDLGRDVLSRLLFGIRNTVAQALLTTSIAFLMGTFFGLLAAFLGGTTDNIMSRLVDAIMSLPPLILALLVLSIFGNSLSVLVCIVALLDGTRFFRLSRAVGMNIVVMPYVEVARLRGEGFFWCIRREILPNVIVPMSAEFGIRFCYAFLFISGLSFLGLGLHLSFLGIGLQPPAANLGSMVRETSNLISFGDFTPLIPAAAVAFLTISANFVIDYFQSLKAGLD
jgi:peptide/nickel transport system permease protein